MAAGRIVGLDWWRAVLMLAGLLVHATLWLEPVPLFRAIVAASHAFRMGAFFAVSGYLAALVLDRRHPGTWLRERLFQLGVPLLFGWTVLSPFVWLVAATRRNPPDAVLPLLLDWHHLWFLAALLGYSAVAVLLHVADRRRGLFARVPVVLARPHQAARLVLLAVAGASMLLATAGTALLHRALPGGLASAFSNGEQIAGDLPMFVLGFVLARCAPLRLAVVGAPRLALAVVLAVASSGGLIMASSLLGLVVVTEELASFAGTLGVALCPPAAFALILRSALTIRHLPAVMRRLSDASYTMYLCHLPIGAVINTRLHATGMNPHVAFVLCVIGSGLGSYAVHGVAARWLPTLLLLLNGQRRRRAASLVDEAGDDVAIGAAHLHAGA